MPLRIPMYRRPFCVEGVKRASSDSVSLQIQSSQIEYIHTQSPPPPENPTSSDKFFFLSHSHMFKKNICRTESLGSIMDSVSLFYSHTPELVSQALHGSFWEGASGCHLRRHLHLLQVPRIVTARVAGIHLRGTTHPLATSALRKNCCTIPIRTIGKENTIIMTSS